MATEISSISQISSDQVEEQQTILTEFIQEKYPDVDLSRGVFHDLVQYLNAIFAAKEQQELANLKTARSLLAITEDPDVADTDSVDNILSNYNVTRITGTKATGTIMLEFSADLSCIIPTGTEFTYNDITYVTESSYLIYESTNTSSKVADRTLVALSDGNYGCTIPVIATAIGSAGCIKKNTVLTVSNISNLFVAYAYDDFYGGTDDETNEVLISKLKSGIATPCWGGRDNIKSLIVNNDKLSGIVDVSVIGMNDTEMQRDQITLFPVSVGGKTDIYIKTAPYTITKTTTIKCTMYATDLEFDYWEVTVPATVLPGMWRVTNVVYDNAALSEAQLTIVSQTPVSTNTELDTKDACYSIYQSILLKFKTKKDSTKEIGTYENFTITCMGIPGVDTIQDYCMQRNITPVDSDVLIKAAVPYIVSAEVKLKHYKHNPVTDAVVASIKDKVATLINIKGFDNYLTSAELSTEIATLLSEDQNVAYVQLSGVILGPNNTIYREASSKQLLIPDMPLNYISKNTVAFFSDIDYIDVVTECVDE